MEGIKPAVTRAKTCRQNVDEGMGSNYLDISQLYHALMGGLLLFILGGVSLPAIGADPTEAALDISLDKPSPKEEIPAAYAHGNPHKPDKRKFKMERPKLAGPSKKVQFKDIPTARKK